MSDHPASSLPIPVKPLRDHSRRVIIGAIFMLFLDAIYNVVMLVLGIVFHDESKCRLRQVTIYLIVGSSVDLSLAAACVVLIWIVPGFKFKSSKNAMIINFSQMKSRIVPIFLIIYPLVRLGLIIYGSVVIFLPFSTWDVKDTKSEYFCEPTPFLFAFVNLVFDSTNVGIIYFFVNLIYRRTVIIVLEPQD